MDTQYIPDSHHMVLSEASTILSQDRLLLDQPEVSIFANIGPAPASKMMLCILLPHAQKVPCVNPRLLCISLGDDMQCALFMCLELIVGGEICSSSF